MKILLRLLILGLCVCSLNASQPERRPNIIFLLADDLGYGDIGPFGQTIIHTPTLDRLAKEGMLGTATRPAAPTSELYNLAADPSEKENVAAVHQDIVAKLEKIMSQEHRPSKEFPFKDTLDKGRGR
jgi:arylsulfatase A-like enzyme